MAGKRKSKQYETVDVRQARMMWQESFDALQALCAERDRLRKAYGPDAEIGQLNERIEEAWEDECGFWEAYCEIAKIIVAA